jgi:hypothetical protein
VTEGIRRCECGGWVHRARECEVCKILVKRHAVADDTTDDLEIQPVHT